VCGRPGAMIHTVRTSPRPVRPDSPPAWASPPAPMSRPSRQPIVHGHDDVGHDHPDPLTSIVTVNGAQPSARRTQ
jgi:hypothetical protein